MKTPMTGEQHQTWRTTYQLLLDTLAVAQNERRLRDEIVDTVDEHGRPDRTVAWVLHERAVMRDTVNRMRAARGLEPADPEALRRAEGMASGHIDYSSKFAIHCADLVHQATDHTPRSPR